MSIEFNKQQLIDNINYLLKESNMKIGELESEAGVSIGYISRITKESSIKPGIDFIINAAHSLNVSVDTLLNVPLSETTPTERYLISFLEKLKRSTADDDLNWVRESPDSLNRMETDINGYALHPLFSYETFMEQGEMEYPEEVSRVVFTSHSFGVHTYICGDCFNLRMKNSSYIYLMNISKSVHRTGDASAYAKEVWMHSPGSGTSFLCSTKSNDIFSTVINDLYATVLEFSKHPKVNKNLQHVIDAFMNDDDLSDDDDLPF